MAVKEVLGSSVRAKSDAPEGGWGYLVCLATVFIFVGCFSHMHSTAIMYKDFMENVGAGVSGLTAVTGVMSISISLAGVFANVTMKRFSLRQVGWAASVGLMSSWILNTRATSVLHLTLFVGVLQGFSSGFLISVAMTSFNQYFVVKRIKFMSVSKVLTALGNMAAPVLLEMSLQEYGFCGTMLLMAGVAAHSLLGVTILHPVQWHQKKTRASVVKGQIDDEYYKETDSKVFNDDKELPEECAVMLNTLTERPNNTTVADKDSPTKGICYDVRESSLAMANQRTARALSIVNTGQGIIIFPIQDKKSKWSSFVEFFDFNLFKDPIFCNISFGLAISLITDMVFFMLLPLSLATLGFKSVEVAWCVALVSGTDLVSRGVIGVVDHFLHISSRKLFFAGTCASFLLRLIYCHVDGFWSVYVVVGGLGFLRGILIVPMMLIYAEYIPEKFTAAFGLSTLVTGILSTILLPLFGILKDYTGSYVITFNVLNGLSLLCIVPWSIEFLKKKRKS